MIVKEYIWTTLVTVGIVVLSTIPIPENPPLEDVPLIDKWVHMVMYGGLVFVMWIDHAVRNKRTFSWAARIIMVLYAIALGGAMELVQAYDFEADAVGALLGLLLCAGLNWKWKEKISARS